MLHDILIARYGGASGVRDKGALEAALFRPQTGYYDSLALEAAALLQSLSLNHPFVDGNKRVVFSLAVAFLRMNGFRIIVGPAEAERFMLKDVIQSHAAIEQIAAWLAKRLHAV